VRLTMAAGSVAANPRYPTVSGHRPLTRSEAKRVCDRRRRHAEPSLRAGADKDASIHRQQIQPPQRKCRDHRTFRRSEQASEYLGQSMVHLLRLGEGETNPKSQTSPGPTALPACSPCPVADNGLRAVPCSTFLRRPVARGAATLFFAYCVPKQPGRGATPGVATLFSAHRADDRYRQWRRHCKLRANHRPGAPLGLHLMGLRLLVPSGAFTVSHNGIVHWRCRCRARCAQRYVDTIGKTHTHKIGKWTAKKNQPPQPYPTQVRAAAGGDLSEFPISPLLPHMTSGLPAPSHPALCHLDAQRQRLNTLPDLHLPPPPIQFGERRHRAFLLAVARAGPRQRQHRQA